MLDPAIPHPHQIPEGTKETTAQDWNCHLIIIHSVSAPPPAGLHGAPALSLPPQGSCSLPRPASG